MLPTKSHSIFPIVGGTVGGVLVVAVVCGIVIVLVALYFARKKGQHTQHRRLVNDMELDSVDEEKT